MNIGAPSEDARLNAEIDRFTTQDPEAPTCPDHGLEMVKSFCPRWRAEVYDCPCEQCEQRVLAENEYDPN